MPLRTKLRLTTRNTWIKVSTSSPAAATPASLGVEKATTSPVRTRITTTATIIRILAESRASAF